MVATSVLRERCLAEAKRLCYAGLDAPTLLREVAGLLGRAAPFETYCAFTNDPLSGLPTLLVGRGALGPRQHRTYIENIYFEEDFDGQRMMVQSRRSVALLSEVTGGKIERALVSREITIPLGLGYELFGVCALGRQQWGGISLIRESDSRRRVSLRRELARVTQALRTASWGTGAFILFAQRRESPILQSSA